MIAWITSIIAACALVCAWYYPGTALCAALGWTSLPLFHAALTIREGRQKRLFVAGIITYLGGFYWLLNTIKDFGGMPLAPALGVFVFYAVASSIQFLIWAFSFDRLPRWCARAGIRAALSWLIAHHFWIKIFPWDFGHTQLGFVPLAQIAGVVGVPGITFIMMWVVESLCGGARVAPLSRVCSLICLSASLGYGVWIEQVLSSQKSSPLSTVMIQGNVALKRYSGMTVFTVNREHYLRTSALVSAKDTLVIWPESTIPEVFPDNAEHVSQGTPLPFFADGSAFLVGGITARSEREFFNSSVLIAPDGSIQPPYHKRILMPFGEYTPLGDWLPWLKEINNTAGDFIAGDSARIFSYPLSDGRTAKVSPLICYEDVVPRLAREATAAGAELLVNQTNDVWFGDTVAPYQHHMIASFRAIENRRFLLRSTNTGLTAVVDPMGRTLASLPPYSETVLPMEVSLLNIPSTFTNLPIPLIWLIIAALGVASIVLGSIRGPKKTV